MLKKILFIVSSVFLINQAIAANNISDSLEHLKDQDLQILGKALKAGDKAKWARSLRIASDSKSNLVKTIIEWRWLTAHDGIASFEKTKQFYLNNSDWPKRNILKRQVEYRLQKKTNESSVLLWFQNNTPISGQGRLKLSEALIKKGFNKSGNWLIKRASWQAVSDILSDQCWLNDLPDQKERLSNSLRCLGEDSPQNIDELLHSVHFLTYKLLMGEV